MKLPCDQIADFVAAISVRPDVFDDLDGGQGGTRIYRHGAEMFCRHCDTENLDDANLCSGCGTPLKDTASVLQPVFEIGGTGAP